MIIHKRLNSREELIDYFNELVEWCINPEQSIWKEEDAKKLKPLFDRQTVSNKLFRFYQKCLKEYATRNVEIRNSVRGLQPEELAETFLFKDVSDQDGDDFKFELPLKFPHSFPLVVSGIIDCDFDKYGNIKICFVDFVTLEELKNDSDK